MKNVEISYKPRCSIYPKDSLLDSTRPDPTAPFRPKNLCVCTMCSVYHARNWVSCLRKFMEKPRHTKLKHSKNEKKSSNLFFITSNFLLFFRHLPHSRNRIYSCSVLTALWMNTNAKQWFFIMTIFRMAMEFFSRTYDLFVFPTNFLCDASILMVMIVI